MIETNPIEPFRHFCQHVLPAVYDDSLSYYELLCKLTQKLNEIITSDNTQIDAINEIKRLYDQLKLYVENYFKNLDIQPEINKKLDEMGSSGDMARYISMYLQGVQMYGFKNIEEMKNSELLGFGAVCKVLGTSDYLVGDGFYYNVRHARTDDVIDDNNVIALKNTELVAEKIPYYHDNEIKKMIDNVTVGLENLTNTHNTQIGDLNSLVTNEKSNIVGAINEITNGIDTKISNGVNDKVGNLEELTTNNKSNVVNSINDLKNHNDNIIGSISNLQTGNKNNLVEAINSVNNTVIPITKGGTGAENATTARVNLGGILVPTILYDNFSGGDNTIYLSDSIIHYHYITIFYRDVDQTPNNFSATFNTATSLVVSLPVFNMSENDYYAKCGSAECTGTTIILKNTGWFYRTGGGTTSAKLNCIKIIKVVGYK